jgi:hypothetical protein
MCHFIICAAQLEAEHRLEIFAFEENITFQSVAQVCCVCEGSFGDNFVDAGGEDKAEILDA